MKNKFLIIFVSLLMSSIILQSCTTTGRARKKDCRGKTKHRLPNGIYM